MRVMVTGAANGIGAQAARLLQEAGADVVPVDVEPAEGIQLDLSDMAAIADFEPEGRFDALINAAGLPPRPGQETQVLMVNFHGLRAFTNRMIPAMAPGGSIVSMASKAGGKWRENLAQVKRFLDVAPQDTAAFVAQERIDAVRSYDLSKEALIVWTKAQTARLQGLGLRANTVSPAAVDTRILSDFMTAFGARARDGVALTHRAGRPDEVAQALVFLAGPASSWIKGSDLVVDGGLDARLSCAALDITELRDS